jgi:hypothetical protein
MLGRLSSECASAVLSARAAAHLRHGRCHVVDLGRELVIALVERGANLLEHVGSAIKGNQGQ